MNDPIQEQLIQARKNQILDATAKVFSQKGFHSTTIKDIAREAGIADGTIYNYFKNKNALLIGVFERMTELVKPDDQQIASLLQDDLRTFIVSFLQLPLNALYEDDFRLFRVIVSEMMTNEELRELYYTHILEPTINIAESYLQQWIETQNAFAEVDVELTVRILSSAVMGLMVQSVMGDKTLKAKWAVLPEFLADLIISGLGQSER